MVSGFFEQPKKVKEFGGKGTTLKERRAARTGQALNLPQFITMPDGTKIPILIWRQAPSEWDITEITTDVTTGKPGGNVIESGGNIYLPIVSAQYLTQDVLDQIEQFYTFGVDDAGNIAKQGAPLDTNTDLADFSAIDAIPRSSIYYTYLQPLGITQEEANKNDLTSQWLDFYGNLKLSGQDKAWADSLGENINPDDVIKQQLFSTTKAGQEQVKQQMGQQRLQQEAEGNIKLGEANARVQQMQTDANAPKQPIPTETNPGGRIIYAGETPEGGIRPNDIVVAQSEEEASKMGAASWIPASDWFGQGRHTIAENEAGRVTALSNQGGSTPIQEGRSAEQTGRWKALGSEGNQAVSSPGETFTDVTGLQTQGKPVTGSFTTPPTRAPYQTTFGGQQAMEAQAATQVKITEQQRKWQELVAKAQERQRLLSARPQSVVKF